MKKVICKEGHKHSDEEHAAQCDAIYATEVHADASGPRDQPTAAEYQYPSIDDVREERTKYREQRDELVEALRELIYAHDAGEVTRDDWVKARQALAKVQQK